ncbi:hypothetical protein K6W80_32560, partial [Burkholderia contaminans]|nr:hypothetical protein [Burkholderia contaminans]
GLSVGGRGRGGPRGGGARPPDDFLGLLALGLSMGQWLSLPMILAGVALMVWAYRRRAATAAA